MSGAMNEATGPGIAARLTTGLTTGYRRLSRNAGALLLLAGLAYLVLGPLIQLQLQAFSDGGRGFRLAFASSRIGATAVNTVILALGSLCIGMVCGTLLAWWAIQLPERLRFLRVMPVLPIPGR